LQELSTVLQRVRRQGFAYDLEENESHIRCVAAPIWDHSNAVNASLSITGPAVRMSTTRLRELAPLVKEAGLRISRDLGYQPKGEMSRNSEQSRAPYENKFRTSAIVR